MEDIPVKNNGETYTPGEFNSFQINSREMILSSGQTLSEADTEQGSKALAIYAARSTFYVDSGVDGTAYILTPSGTLVAPPTLIDGMMVRFRANFVNSIVAPTVNVDGLGAKDIVLPTGLALSTRDVCVIQDTSLRYDLASDKFFLLKYIEDADFYLDTGTSTAYQLDAVPGQKNPTKYLEGLQIWFRPANSNTVSNPTIEVDALGPITVTQEDGVSPIAINDLVTTQDVHLRYDAGNNKFLLLNGAAIVVLDKATFFTDSGVANAYVLAAAGGETAPTSYSEGMMVRFRPANNNITVISVTSITRVSTTATVTTAVPHGQITGAIVRIQGTNEVQYRGGRIITVTGASTFTYTVLSTLPTPATGTITAQLSASTVNVSSLGLKDIKLRDGTTDPTINVLNTSNDITLRFDAGNDVCVIVPAEEADTYEAVTITNNDYILFPVDQLPAPTNYYRGMVLRFIPDLTNPTFGHIEVNVNNLGLKNLAVQEIGIFWDIGTLRAGTQTTWVYDGTNFVLQGTQFTTPPSTRAITGIGAWVNFNGTGVVAIRASANVSGVSDNGIGNYTVNFISSFPDANYTVSGTKATNTAESDVFVASGGVDGPATNKTADVCQIYVRLKAAPADAEVVMVNFVR